MLKSKDNKYLLIRRSGNKYPERGPIWDIVGGRIDPGTSLIKNLKREVEEETSLDLIHDVRLVAAQDILRLEKKHIVRLTYLGFIEGEPKLNEDHIEYKCFH